MYVSEELLSVDVKFVIGVWYVDIQYEKYLPFTNECKAPESLIETDSSNTDKNSLMLDGKISGYLGERSEHLSVDACGFLHLLEPRKGKGSRSCDRSRH